MELIGPRGPLWIGLFAFILALPSVLGGLAMDDHVLLAAGERGGAPWNVFSFSHLGDVRSWQERGAVGWWADPDLRVAFFRPLSSLTHALDAALWPDAVWFMHLENVATYAVLCALVAALFRRLRIGASTVLVAAVLFVVDDAHAQAVGWISARNHLLAGVFGVASILAHHRWRTKGRGGPWPAMLLLGLALGSAEAGLAYAAYLVAHALAYEEGPLWRRLRVVAPYAALIVVWRVGYGAAGFGVSGTGLYLDAGSDPLGFLAVVGPRTAVLVAAQLTLPIATVANVAPEVWLPCAAIVGAALWWSRTMLREHRHARFFVLGMLGSAIPFCATLPSDRVLLPVGIGAAGWLGLAVRRLLGTHPARLRSAGGILGLHAGLSAALFVPSLFLVKALDTEARRVPAVLEASDTIVMNAPSELPLLYATEICRIELTPCPQHLYPLFVGMSEVVVERIDARTVEVRAEDGWFASPIDQISRDPDEGFALGEEIALDHMTVVVTAIDPSDASGGRPVAAHMRFDRPLEAFAWVQWDGREPTVVAPPAVGEIRRAKAGL